MGSDSGSNSGSASGSSVVSGFGVVSTAILTILCSDAVVTLSVVVIAVVVIAVVVVVVGYSVEFLKLATAADGVVVSWSSARVVMFPTTMILPIWSVLIVVASGSSVVALTSGSLSALQIIVSAICATSSWQLTISSSQQNSF